MNQKLTRKSSVWTLFRELIISSLVIIILVGLACLFYWHKYDRQSFFIKHLFYISYIELFWKNPLKNANLRQDERNQEGIINNIAIAYGVKIKSLSENQYVISINGQKTDIVIINQPPVQRIIFGDQILFSEDDYALNPEGKEVLLTVGNVLKKQLLQIKEIQIQGHTDPSPSMKFDSNLYLGALRAIEVFRFLQNNVGIDPTQNLMSATSFGEYKPLQRSDNYAEYNEAQLVQDNSTQELRDKNRRIELRLFYRYKSLHSK